MLRAIMPTRTDRVAARRTVQSSAHVQAMAIALALFLPCATAAQTPAQSGDGTALCDIVARTVLAIDPPKDWRGPWQSPIRALGKASGGTISVDARRGVPTRPRRWTSFAGNTEQTPLS